jgi:ATP-dependent RNA helicase RhlE
VPPCAEDYVHRVGRTGRVDLRGDAFVFVSPEEEHDLQDIERTLGKRLERATLPDFDYSRRPAEKLEIPLGVRLAEMRSKRRAQQSGRPAAGAGRPASARGRFAGRRA